MDEGEWTTLIDWKQSAQILANAPNQLAVLGQGPRFTLFLNDEEIATYEDDTLARGEVGIGFSLYETGIETELEFDDFQVAAPD